MRVYSRNNLHWNGYDLMLGDRKVSAIYQKDDNPRLFEVEYPDGVMSADYYNQTWAKEHAYEIALEELNKTDEETALGASLVRLNDISGTYPQPEAKTSVRAS